MKIPLVYLDTSVLGGCHDPEFAPWSNGLLQDFRNGLYLPVLSDLLAAEIARAPEPVRRIYRELRGIEHHAVQTGPEVLELRRAYADRSVLGPRYAADMLHVALSTVSNAEMLASWNFKHIVRFDKIRQFNAVNLELGFRQVAIHSPREVTTYGRDADRRG
jgi:hypothetical protein